jgi:hypothetical protein
MPKIKYVQNGIWEYGDDIFDMDRLYINEERRLIKTSHRKIK